MLNSYSYLQLLQICYGLAKRNKKMYVWIIIKVCFNLRDSFSSQENI